MPIIQVPFQLLPGERQNRLEETEKHKWCLEHFGEEAPNGIYRWWLLPQCVGCFTREQDAIFFALKYGNQNT